MLFHCKAIPNKGVSGMSNFQETKRNSDHGDKRHSTNSNQTASSGDTHTYPQAEPFSADNQEKGYLRQRITQRCQEKCIPRGTYLNFKQKVTAPIRNICE